MKLSEIVDELSLEVKTGKESLPGNVTGAYVSDLLSDVMANSDAGNIWITLQTHINIVAVASLKKISAIIIVGGRKPQDDTIQKAESEKIPIMLTAMPAFKVAGKIYQMFQ